MKLNALNIRRKKLLGTTFTRRSPFASSCALLTLSCSISSATVIVSSTEPGLAEGVLLDIRDNNSVSTNISAAQSRGEEFELDTISVNSGATIVQASGLVAAVNGITIQANVAANTTSTSATVVFFTGDAAAASFTGTDNSAANFITGSGLTILANETFSLEGLMPPITNSSFITFELTDSFEIGTSDSVSVLIFGDGGTINHLEGTGNGGGRFGFTGTGIAGPSGTRNLNALIHGSIVPEPSSLALLALGGFAFLRRKR